MSKAGILIVEDSFTMSCHLQAVLIQEGYNVVGVTDNAEKAIELASKLDPDIILMDVILNGKMDGVEAAGIIKAEYDIPVVFITSISDRQTINRAKLTEPYGYLLKPFEDSDVFPILEMALYKHRMEVGLKRSEERFYTTLNSITDVVISINNNFRIMYINPSAEKVLGVSMAEVYDQVIFEVLTLKDNSIDEHINPFQSVLGVGSINAMPEDLTLITSNGVCVPIGDGAINPLINEKGILSGLLITFKDYTIHEQLRKLKEDTERTRIAAIIEGQENERGRIAKDLHDGIGQMLNVIKLSAANIIRDKIKAGYFDKLLDETITEVKRISENLLPSKLRDFALPVSIHSICMRIEKATKKTISFSHYGDFSSLDQSTKINLFRIVQEALSNSVNHSGANSISIQLNRLDETIELSIEDDGIGIVHQETNGSTTHHGIANMKERALMMNGKFGIETDVARGTLIFVKVPYKDYEEVENTYSR